MCAVMCIVLFISQLFKATYYKSVSKDVFQFDNSPVSFIVYVLLISLFWPWFFTVVFNHV